MNTGRFTVRRYRQVLGSPGATRFFVPAAVARLGVAITGLAMMWSVLGTSGSWGRAGTVTGIFTAMDALVGPQVARLIDRWGQRPVVTVTTAAFTADCTGFVLGCAGTWPAPVMFALAGTAGGTAPPVGALAAARWRASLGSADALRTALSLEGALNDLTFLVGPVLVTTLGTVIAPWSGLVLSNVLIVVGTTGLLTARSSEPAPNRSSRDHPPGRRLLTPPFAALGAAHLALGFFFGGIGMAITAFAVAHDVPALTGLVTAVSGVVSLGAGLVYGATGRGHPLPLMITASLIITGGTALLALTPTVPALFVGYAVVGGCVALVLIPASVLLHEAIDRDVVTQALTWINSASAVGISTAAPLVGLWIQLHGWRAGFLALALLTACLPAVLLLTYPVLNDASAVRTNSGNPRNPRFLARVRGLRTMEDSCDTE